MSVKNSQIAKFFENQTIFITGGTGLLGKLLIEKLVRVCCFVKIYILIRPKKGKSTQQRFDEFFDHPCFDLIRNKNLKDKVLLVSGDCQKPFLGLSPEDAEILKNETTCVLHAAANVRFDQSLREAGDMIRTAGDVLDLAKHMTLLKVLVYISTAYSNCVHGHVKEDFYEPPIRPETLLELSKLEDRVLAKITPDVLKQWPNTYVFAKSVTENVFRDANLDVPVAIVRPSIIINTLEEPVKGWIDNNYGVVGLIMGGFMGVVRSFHAKNQNCANLVPADFVVNCILAAAWKTQKSKKILIYNCVGQQISIESISKITQSFYWDTASVKYLWYKSFQVRTKFWHRIYVFFYTLLGFLVDGILLCLGKPAKTVQRLKLVNNALDAFSYFGVNQWIFDQHNVDELWEEMCDDDKILFKFNLKIEWYNYFHDCLLGIRLYLLKDPIQTLPRGQKKLKVLFVLHYTVVIFVYYFIYVFLKSVLVFVFSQYNM